MQAKDKAFLVPFNPLAHSGLQENDKLRRQYIEGGIFGKFTSRRLIEPARVDDTKVTAYCTPQMQVLNLIAPCRTHLVGRLRLSAGNDNVEPTETM